MVKFLASNVEEFGSQTSHPTTASQVVINLHSNLNVCPNDDTPLSIKISAPTIHHIDIEILSFCHM